MGTDDVIMELTIVGGRYVNDIYAVIDRIGINKVNEVKKGRLGNFSTLTLFLKISEREVVRMRKELMANLSVDGRLLPMYVHGDWMHMYVFETIAFKEE